LLKAPSGPTVVSIVGVNGTAKPPPLPNSRISSSRRKKRAARCVATPFAPPPSSNSNSGHTPQGRSHRRRVWRGRCVRAHDAVTAAQARKADYLFIDTAGRLHTKHNLMQELHKLHRVIGKQLPSAPHEVLLVLDGSTGMNALNQAREFNKAVPLTGLIVTKLDGTSKGGMVVAIQKELGLPIKFIGLGEQPDDLQPFDAKQFAQALFEE